ncbi:MAG: serine protease [Oscillibacter sp.]|nr:serine protease [Oscillibacter sp.]
MKFLTLAALLVLLTVPAQAKCDASAAHPDTARAIVCTPWGCFRLPDFYCPDCGNTLTVPNTSKPTPTVPDTNQPAAPETPAAPVIVPETPTAPESPATPVTTPESVEGMSEYELEVVRLVNAERARYGLSALAADAELSRVARYKSRDMREKGYFSHESPTYGTPFQMMKSFGITYRTAGENIAYGYATPAKVVEAWMNSEGHRANILNASYTRLGVGYVADGHYWTQMFIG